MKPFSKEEWEKIPYDIRLQHTEYVFKALLAHLYEGGTFRTLIYRRLGFKHDSYCDLYYAGGLAISNALFEAGEEDKKHERELSNITALPCVEYV